METPRCHPFVEKRTVHSRNLWSQFERGLWEIGELPLRAEVYWCPQGHYSHDQYFHPNIQHGQLGLSGAVIKRFERVNKDILVLWWTARDITTAILTLSLLGSKLRFFSWIFSATPNSNNWKLRLFPLYSRWTRFMSITKIWQSFSK